MARPTYTDTLIANNAALVEMNRVLGNLEKQFQRTTRITKEANKVSEKANEIALTRGQASSKLVDRLKKEGKELNLISSSLTQTKKNFDTFRDIVGIKGKTGTVIAGMEYLDLLLSSSSQTIKVFGFEAATARKIMYGFLPPGMFRAVNKISTSLRATSAALRQIAGEGEDEKKIKNYINKNNLEKNIFLINYVDNIFPVIRNSEACILSSLWEDPGFVIIESAFCRKAVFSSNCLTGPSEIITDEHNGFLFESNDIQSFLINFERLVKKMKDKKILLNNLKYMKRFTLFNHYKVLKELLLT